MQEIEQFRMTQSRNISFAEIIVEEARECEETKTLVENSQKDTAKEEELDVSEDAGQGSMIVLDSHRSQSNSCADSGLPNSSNNSGAEDKKEPKGVNQNALANYINGMKHMHNVELKCGEMLVKTINSYDDQLLEVITAIYQEYREKVQADIKNLKELQSKNPSLKFEDKYHCKILQSKNIHEFLFSSEKSINRNN
jgi:hypothetical protein